MIINLSKIDFGGITGGKSKPEEVFDVQPTTAEQTITPTEGSVFSGGTVRAVTSEIDNNIVPENIKEGLNILGVEGTFFPRSDVFVVPDGIKFAYSNFSEIPSNWDFSNVTDMSKMFEYCPSITTIPQLNTSSVTNMENMFTGCDNLTSIPQLGTSNVTSMKEMFMSCSRLTAIPQLDTSKVTNMYGMFDSCTNLTSIPQLGTSNVTSMSNMFYNCTNLTSIPQLDTSNVTSMSSMFSQCSNLTTIPQLNTSKVTDMYGMFDSCSRLTTVEGIDFSGLTSDLDSLFGWGSDGLLVTRFIVNGKINVSIRGDGNFERLTAIDYDSVKSILAAADRTGNNDAKELAFNITMNDPYGELVTLVASCSTKGWTITGLTLQ